MPFTAGDLGVEAVNLLSVAFDDAIKTNVVFERVRTDDVIVVAIENTDSDTPGLINVSSDGFKF